MEFNPDMFAALLDLLRHSGVDEFEGFGFKVRFRYPGTMADKGTAEILSPAQPVSNPVPKTLWDDPTLWPEGKKPGFPGSRR